MQKAIGNKMPCKKEDMWKQVCKAWYGVAQNVREELYNLCQGEPQILLKQNSVQRNTYCTMFAYKFVYVFSFIFFHCCVFIGMYLIFIYTCCLMIYRNKTA